MLPGVFYRCGWFVIFMNSMTGTSAPDLVVRFCGAHMAIAPLSLMREMVFRGLSVFIVSVHLAKFVLVGHIEIKPICVSAIIVLIGGTSILGIVYVYLSGMRTSLSMGFCQVFPVDQKTV